MGTAARPEEEMESRQNPAQDAPTPAVKDGAAAGSWVPKKWEFIIIILTIAP